MRLKTYRASNTAEALSLVRDDLGMDAVIVSIVEGSGEVSVTAALEDRPFVGDAPEGVPQDAPPSEFDEPFAALCERHNLSDDFVRQLAGGFCAPSPSSSFGERLERGLGKSLAFQPLDFSGVVGSPIVLVGPPGVGKTVTLAKLALRAEGQDQPVHLITTDTEKAGAVEQLRSYAQALSLTVSTASTMDDLWKALQDAPKNTRLLVDTPGINPFRESELKRLAEVILTLRVSPLLVMPAGGDVVDHLEMMEAFQCLGAGRVLLTRVDLTRRLGGVLEALHRSQLKCVAFNNSPYIADPLYDAGPRAWAQLLMTHGGEPHKFDYDWTEKEAAHG